MKYLLFVLLLVTILIISGCVSESKNNVVTRTQTTTQPSVAITTPEQQTATFPTPKYKVGDVISKEMPYYYQGFMISGYNDKTGKYSRVELARANCGNGKYGIWWRPGGNNWEDLDVSSMEGAYPIYLGHIDVPSSIPSYRELSPNELMKC